MNRNLWGVFIYELKRNILRRGFLITTFGLPLIGIVLFLGIQAFTGNDDSSEALSNFTFDLELAEVVGYVDQSGLFEEPSGADNPLTGLLLGYPDEDAADAALEADEIDQYYVIPADYAQTGDLRLVMPTFSLANVSSAAFENLFYSQLLDEIDLTTLSLIAQPAFYENTVLEREGAAEESSSDGDTGVATMFAFLLILGLFTTNGYLMQSLIEEKETRIIEVLISSVRPVELLVGKIFALGVLGLFQISVYLIAIILGSQLVGRNVPVLANVELDAQIVALAVVYFIAGYLLFAAMFSVVGVVANSVSEAPNITIIFVLPAMLPFIFIDAIVQEPHGTLSTVFSLFPLSSPLTMIIRASTGTASAVDIALSLGILAVSILAVMWFAGRMFRVQTLLAGKRPSIGDLRRIVFDS